MTRPSLAGSGDTGRLRRVEASPPDASNTSGGVRVSLTPPGPKTNADTHAGQGPANCGTTFAGPSRADPDLWMVLWVPDRTMGCPHCGPWVREQKARAYLAKIGDTPLYKRVIAKAAWASLSRGLRRADLDYLQVPTDGDQRVVLAAGGPGELVADNEAEVLALLAGYPAKCGMNISASTDWQPTRSVPAPAKVDDDDQVEGYDFRYLVGVGLEHARQVAVDNGLYVGEAPGRGGAAFLLRKTQDPLPWQRFKRWAMVEGIEDLTRRRAEARARREVREAAA